MSGSSPLARPIFDPVDTLFDPNDVTARDDVVESPSLSSSNALARFEFEPRKSKEGTKVLMVEWEDDVSTKDVKGDWELSWEGKKTVLPAREQHPGDGEEMPVNRLYFLLGPGVSVPSTVKLQKGSIVWRTNPLPAIFSPELGATARQAGKRGVLHTIWAKKRLQVLQKEIENESKDNVEGIGLEMAQAEKDWIEQNFGVTAKTGSVSAASSQQSATASTNLNSPTSPRSPGGGRLMDKFKGLKVGTTAQDLQSRGAENNQPDNYHNPLSPETSDIAVGSFGSFAAIKGPPSSSPLASKQPQTPQSVQRKAATQRQQPQQQSRAAMGSLNAFADGGSAGAGASTAGDDKQDDLFALPMSPRTPAGSATTSPFAFGAQDTMRYVKGEKAA